METEFPVSSADVVEVQKVQFSILSPSEIRKMSVLQVKNSAGLKDPRLGSQTVKCNTCLNGYRSCPGHLGHLELAKPIFHIGFMKTVLSIMKCVCFQCSRIIADKNDHTFQQALKIKNPKRRLSEIKKPRCAGVIEFNTEALFTCGARQPKLTIEGMHMIAEFKNNNQEKIKLAADKVLNILKRISDEDCQSLGFNPKFARPEWMILQVLPIPPPHVRPFIVDRTSLIKDDLTYALTEIIRHNQNLKKQEQDGAPAHRIELFTLLLQYHISTYFDNELPGQPRVVNPKSKNDIKSLCTRLKGKEGRIRENLMGKRVNYSARTVITPDPTLNIDEVGVPLSIAMDLTFTETVTPHNMERLKELVSNGPRPPPGKTGANYITTESGKRLNLRRCDPIYYFEEGLKVERHLQDGDLVLLNRQPTLHKMSIMGHRIKIMPYSSFGLNMSVTSPYNADFDGDELTMHVPQSLETKAEVSELMMVPKCIVSPQSNRPVIGIVQDTLLGCRKITKRDTFIEKDIFMNMLMLKEDWDWEVPVPAILKPRPFWTGKQVISVIIPEKVNLLSRSAWHSDQEKGFITPGDTQVRIEEGILLTGTLCKNTLGTNNGSLVHVIWEDFGPDAAMKFLANTQRLVNYWLRHHGFTFGTGDIITDSATNAEINKTISRAKDDVEVLIKKFRRNILRPDLGKTIRETFEDRVNQVLNVARDDAGIIAQKSLAETNNLKAMMTAGSTKGNLLNFSQMTACVGQQNVEGKRIPFEFYRRTLPHFTKDDYGPESRGFVENSYLCGLTPIEFFFHAVGGRDGLIDTAVKVSDSGYMQRRLVKAMEDIMVTYDGTVRNSLGDVIQFLYGEDGMDAVWIESQKLDSLKMNKSEFDRTFKYDYDHENWLPEYLTDEQRDELREQPEVIDAEYRQLEADRLQLGTQIATNGVTTWPLPVNIKRHIWYAQKKFKTEPLSPISDIQPDEIVKAVDRLQIELQNRLLVVPGNDAVSVEAQRNGTMLFNILLRSTLASKRVLEEYELSRKAFNWVTDEIVSRFQQSVVTPGEMVGCVAAQSIGEPTTQMTLRTVHYAGINATNVTVGIPRLRELINVSKTIKTPSLSVYLRPEFRTLQEEAIKVQRDLEYTTLKSVTQATEIWYDPDPRTSIIEEDFEWVRDFIDLDEEKDELDALSPWLIRIKLDREMKMHTSLTMDDIAEKINTGLYGLKCINNNDNALNLILRIRTEGYASEVEEDEVIVLKRTVLNTILEYFVLKGIPEIKKAFLKQVTEKRFDAVDGFTNSEEEWMLVTEGVNLLAAMCHESVDPTRTTSNHLTAIMEVLGIEAARRCLLDELRVVITFNGSYVNYRHLAILSDVMTHHGYLMAISRHGINRNETGPLMRCSFEETVKMLLDAGSHAEIDCLRGVSENIMLGQLAPMGTGLCEPYLDLKALESDDVLPPGSHPNSPSPIREYSFSPYSSRLACSGTSLQSPIYIGSSSHSPTNPYSPTTPSYTLVSPTHTATSPIYHCRSPSTSPSYSQASPSASPSYPPTSPPHSPTSLRPPRASIGKNKSPNED